jgi:hypothetical protein
VTNETRIDGQTTHNAEYLLERQRVFVRLLPRRTASYGSQLAAGAPGRLSRSAGVRSFWSPCAARDGVAGRPSADLRDRVRKLGFAVQAKDVSHLTHNCIVGRDAGQRGIEV